METLTPMQIIMEQIANVTTVTGNVFDLITSNLYLAFFASVALIGCGVHVFNLVKGASR